MFGTLSVTIGGEPVAAWRTRKTASLFAYLAYRAGRTVPREVLADLFWPEAPDGGRNSLSVALSTIRELLGEHASTILKWDRVSVGILANALATDVAAFHGHWQRARAPGGPCLGDLEACVRLAAEPLLEGFYDEWVLLERDVLAAQRAEAALALAAMYLDRGTPARAVETARLVLVADELNEDAHRLIVLAHKKNGNIAAALRQYALMERTLHTELKTPPSETSASLKRELEDEAGGRLRDLLAPSNLPSGFTRFFGRKEETATVEAQLLQQRRRLVTLIGPGGIGKTRMAVEVAHRMAKPLGGRVWWVPMGGVDRAELLPDRVLSALGVTQNPPRDPFQTIGLVLGSRPALVVLDGLEHLGQDGALATRTLLERVRCVACLCTSRAALNLQGECRIQIAPLGVEDGEEGPSPSLELFLDRSELAGSRLELGGPDLGDARALCRVLEGIPLAIELAASRLTDLTVADLLRRIEDRFGLLESDELDRAERHRSLAATLEWSIQLLSPPARRAFGALCVFRNGFDAAAVGTVLGDPSPGPALAELVRHSLVERRESPSGARYAMLDTMREFALRRTEPRELQGFAHRHAIHFERLAEQCHHHARGQDQARWFEMLDTESDNLNAALDWCLAANGDPELGRSIVGYLHHYWMFRRSFSPSKLYAQRLLECPGGDLASDAVGRCRFTLSGVSMYGGDAATALESGTRSTAVWRELGDPWWLAYSVAWEGVMGFLIGDLAKATAFLEEAVEISHGVSDPWIRSYSRLHLGFVCLLLGDASRATRLTAEGLGEARRSGDGWLLAYAEFIAAALETATGQDWAVVAGSAERAHLGFDAIKDQWCAAWALNLRGLAACRQGDPDSGWRFHLESLHRRSDMEDWSGVPVALDGLADAAERLGALEVASCIHAASDEWALRLGVPRLTIFQPACDDVRARIQARGDPSGANSTRRVSVEEILANWDRPPI
jgi:predicted ATPase/DNA-binding SARP family transcriptional activator